jgi:hypothetical protein
MVTGDVFWGWMACVGVARVAHAPLQELFPIVKQELLRWCTLTQPAFQKSVEDVLTEGFIEKVDQDTGTMRVSGGDHAAGGGGAARR